MEPYSKPEGEARVDEKDEAIRDEQEEKECPKIGCTRGSELQSAGPQKGGLTCDGCFVII